MDHIFDDSDDSFNFGKSFELSFKQRLYGFIICCVIGFIFSLIGVLMLFGMNFSGFGICYSLGNIITIISTFFIFGLIKQIKSMFKSLHKACASIIFILSIIMTIISAVVLNNVGLCIIFLIIQIGAFIWYSILSIPGGQTLCCACVNSFV